MFFGQSEMLFAALRLMRRTGAIASIMVFYLALSACTSLPGSTNQNVNGSRVNYVSIGHGEPLVVFETGMGIAMSTWKPIIEGVAAQARVFAYNRPGYGASSSNYKPRSSASNARWLRRILRDTGHEPPFVLVGHSLGSLYVNAFARIYPDDVAGVVMIDGSHPDQFDYLKETHPAMFAVLMASAASGRRGYEIDVLNGAKLDFAGLGPFPQIPLVVLTAEKRSFLEPKSFREQWLVYQQNLARLSKHSTHLTVPGSDHFIHKSQPAAVVRAIRRVVSQTR